MRQSLRSTYVVLIGLAAAALVACAPVAGPSDSGSGMDGGTDSGTDSSTDSGSDSGEGSSSFVVLPGTGQYSIPDQMPFGGYQLKGEPDAQPEGCTWSIQDADGVVAFENQGIYAFITDIPEGTVFVTSGCPDWEQFE